jgi:predicted DNA-binding transcriptional regulator AlpA
MIDKQNLSIVEVCQIFGINKSTFYRNLQKHKELNKESIKSFREKKIEEEQYL